MSIEKGKEINMYGIQDWFQQHNSTFNEYMPIIPSTQFISGYIKHRLPERFSLRITSNQNAEVFKKEVSNSMIQHFCIFQQPSFY